MNTNHVGNTAKQCRLGLFQDSDFAGVLEDSKSTSGGTLCVFGSHTFVTISWRFKKQTSVSHTSTESEIISLHAGLRLDGIPALDLWDLIVSVLGNIIQNHDRTGRPVVCSHRAPRSSNQEIETRSSSDCKNFNLDADANHYTTERPLFAQKDLLIRVIKTSKHVFPVTARTFI